MVATSLIIFPKINRPNWQILCNLYFAYVLFERLEGLGPCPPWLRHWVWSFF